VEEHKTSREWLVTGPTAEAEALHTAQHQQKEPLWLFCAITPCGLVGRYRCFGGRYGLHLQGWNAYDVTTQKSKSDIFTAMITWNYEWNEICQQRKSLFCKRTRGAEVSAEVAPLLPSEWHGSCAGWRRKLGPLITTNFIITICLHATLVERLKHFATTAVSHNKAKRRSSSGNARHQAVRNVVSCRL